MKLITENGNAIGPLEAGDGEADQGLTTPSLGPKGNNLILAGKEGWTEMAKEAGLMAGTKSPGGCLVPVYFHQSSW